MAIYSGFIQLKPYQIPSGKRKQFAIEAMAIAIVDLPIRNGWIFHSYISLPEGI
jgi:hypothetical protein